MSTCSSLHPLPSLPLHLTHLSLSNTFNSPIESYPPSLIHISFGTSFNHPVDNLPTNLTNVSFGRYFNQPIINLPKKITFVSFGDREITNHPGAAGIKQFSNWLQTWEFPPSLTHLFLIVPYPILFPVQSLPLTLTHLEFSGNFKDDISFVLPNITHFSLSSPLTSFFHLFPSLTLLLGFLFIMQILISFLTL